MLLGGVAKVNSALVAVSRKYRQWHFWHSRLGWILSPFLVVALRNSNTPLGAQEEGFDLNQTLLNQGLHAVILNPIMPVEHGEGDFIELNDLWNNMLEQHLLTLE
jgi:hypothetical protein